MKLTKEEINTIRLGVNVAPDYGAIWNNEIVRNLLAHIDHLEERVKELEEAGSLIVKINTERFNKLTEVVEENIALQQELNQLREACEPIAEFVEHTTDDNWFIRSAKGGELSGKIFRRIAELVKGEPTINQINGDTHICEHGVAHCICENCKRGEVMSVSDVCPSCGGLLTYNGCRCHLGIRRPQFPAIPHEKDFLFDEERMHYEKKIKALRLRVAELECINRDTIANMVKQNAIVYDLNQKVEKLEKVKEAAKALREVVHIEGFTYGQCEAFDEALKEAEEV